jgi:hypothetical protein
MRKAPLALICGLLMLGSLAAAAAPTPGAQSPALYSPAGKTAVARPAPLPAWLAEVPNPSPVPLPAPTACGDCPGNCTSSPACSGGVIGDSCELFGRSWSCIQVGSCAKYVCCGCG